MHHSCFVVELETCYLVFDYFRDERVNGFTFTGVLPEFDQDKQLYFFASHKHQDHFDVEILRMAKDYPKVHYILSKDIRLGANYLKRNDIPATIKNQITFVSPEGKYKVDGLTIETLRSTDEGVAFYVEAEGVNIYHAGDLHNWYFEGAGELINGKMERGYKGALRRLESKHIHLAFVVLDPRLEMHTNRGLDYFMQHIHADYVFPMHLWQQYELISGYKKLCLNAAYTERIIDVTGENQLFEIG